MGKMWEIKQSAQTDTLELYIYGEVESDGNFFESENSANKLRAELAMHPNATNINVYINSVGGSVFEGVAIYNQLKRHPAKKTVYIDGFACSIASVIAMAGDEVIMPKNTMMMIHNPWVTASGNSTELRKIADDLDTMSEIAKQAYLEKAGDKITKEEITTMMDAETWLSAEECVKHGLADRFADEEADLSQVTETMQKANLNLQQRIEMHKSLAEQLRQLTQEKKTKEEEPKEPKEPKEENPTIMQVLTGFYN